MNWLWGLAAVLVLWAGIAALRRNAEYARGARRQASPPRTSMPSAADDDIDYDALEQAEREVRDFDALKPPEDFEGEEWGPGAPPRA